MKNINYLIMKEYNKTFYQLDTILDDHDAFTPTTARKAILRVRKIFSSITTISSIIRGEVVDHIREEITS